MKTLSDLRSKIRPMAILALQLFLVVAIFTSVRARVIGLPVVWMWPLLIASIILTFFIIIRYPKYALISLILLEISISAIHMASLPEPYQVGRDTLFDSQYASIIAEKGVWFPAEGTGYAKGYYGYNPVLHFINAMLSLATGLSTFVLSRYVLFLTFRVLFLILFYMIISEIVDEKNSRLKYLATMLVIATPGMAYLDVSRRVMGDIMILFALYALLREKREPSKVHWHLLFMIFALFIVMSNHTIALFFTMFLALAMLFRYIINRKRVKNFLSRYISLPASRIEIIPRLGSKLLILVSFFFIWECAIAPVLMYMDFGYIPDIFSSVFSGKGILTLFVGTGEAALNVYHTYELIIIYSTHILLLLLGLAGFLIFLKTFKKKAAFKITSRNEDFLLYYGGFSIVLLPLLLLLTGSSYDVVVGIFMWFFYIPLCIFIIYVIRYFSILRRWHEVVTNVIIAMLLLLFFTGGLFTGMFTPRIVNRLPYEDLYVGDVRARTPELYYSGYWLSENRAGKNNVLSDVSVFEIYSGVFRFDVASGDYSLQQLYFGNRSMVEYMISRPVTLFYGPYKYNAKLEDFDYLVVNKELLHVPNEVFRVPVPKENLEIIDNEPTLTKIYSNPQVSIYEKNVREQDG